MARVLAVEPYCGGSHRQFLDSWRASSCHEWTILELPAYKWKWRMRHAPLTLGQRAAQWYAQGERWDVVFASDMLNLAEWKSFVPAGVATLPTVMYFHENQLTYPSRTSDERDHHFAFSNFLSAVAASEVWFNSRFHRDDWLNAMLAFLKRMPDYQPIDELEDLHDRIRVESPGVDVVPCDDLRTKGPSALRILWNARWEHDKNPEMFFEALSRLQLEGIEFCADVAGQSYRDSPQVFQRMRQRLGRRIGHWGYAAADEYQGLLSRADVVVATAFHEFFGIGVVEAMLAGARPVLPQRLAYPELLETLPDRDASDYLYDGSLEMLVSQLRELAVAKQEGRSLWTREPKEVQRAVSRYQGVTRAQQMDDALTRLIDR